MSLERLTCFNYLVSSTTKLFALDMVPAELFPTNSIWGFGGPSIPWLSPTTCLKDEIYFPAYEHRILCKLSGKCKVFCSKKLILPPIWLFLCDLTFKWPCKRLKVWEMNSSPFKKTQIYTRIIVIPCIWHTLWWDPSSNLGPKFQVPSIEDTSPSI